jgi:Polyketide cyclase / dehydrase and lipid transport
MQDMTGWGDETAIEMAAAPERVWSLLADVTRMGEWSPVCHRCEWIDGAVGPKIGARFVGHNRQGIVRWSRVCEVTASDPGRDFAFRTFFKGAESTRWRYQLEPTPTGTRVTESYEVVVMPRWVQLLHHVPGMHANARRGARSSMTSTLARIRSTAERRTGT